MTATEVIEEIKRLPREGQREVKQFVQNLETDSPQATYASDEEFDRASQKVFQKYDSLLKKLAQ